MSALKIARGLVGPEGRIAAIDTERGSASLFSHITEFDVIELESFSIEEYTAALRMIEDEGYDICIIDSLSHAWAGEDGLLEFVDNKKRHNANGLSPWIDATPLQNRFIGVMLATKMHLIVTLRTKMKWLIEADDRGKQIPKKLGLTPIQREDMEYEFTAVCNINRDHVLSISKTRIDEIDDQTFIKPGADFAAVLKNWLDSAEPPPPPDPHDIRWQRWIAIRDKHKYPKDGLKARLAEKGYTGAFKVIPLDVIDGVLNEGENPLPAPAVPTAPVTPAAPTTPAPAPPREPDPREPGDEPEDVAAPTAPNAPNAPPVLC